MQADQSILASLYVEHFFTNVPVDEKNDTIFNFLYKNNSIPHSSIKPNILKLDCMPAQQMSFSKTIMPISTPKLIVLLEEINSTHGSAPIKYPTSNSRYLNQLLNPKYISTM